MPRHATFGVFHELPGGVWTKETCAICDAMGDGIRCVGCSLLFCFVCYGLHIVDKSDACYQAAAPFARSARRPR